MVVPHAHLDQHPYERRSNRFLEPLHAAGTAEPAGRLADPVDDIEVCVVRSHVDLAAVRAEGADEARELRMAARL
jgi:hypothetical protein